MVLARRGRNFSSFSLRVMCDNHTNSETHCSKTNIKGTIRSVLGERIVGLCKARARNLKRKISVPALLPLTLLLTTGGTQGKLGNFFEDPSPRPAEDQSEHKNSVKSDDEDNSEQRHLEDSPTGLVYARVSSEKQLNGEDDDEAKNGDEKSFDEGSIQGQIDELRTLAQKEGIELPYDAITDEAKTGTNFERDGIQQVFEISKRKELDYLLVEKVDRVGRNAPETLYFLYILQSECDVTLLTPSGEHDVNKVEGLMHTTLLSLMAEVQNEIRTNKAKKERIRGFLHKKNWKCKSPTVPLGYKETDDGWLAVNEEEKAIVRDIFAKFVECQTYAATKKYIDAKYGTEMLEGHQVKTILQTSVYIGKPRLPEDWLTETTYENNLEEPKLHLLRSGDEPSVNLKNKTPRGFVDPKVEVSEETFKEVQEIIAEKNKVGSTDKDTQGLLDFIEGFSLFAVVNGSEPAKLLHHCGEPLVHDGQRDLKGRKIHRYRCRRCEKDEDAESYYRRWPKNEELEQIQLIQQVLDGNTELFENLD